jgi:beta-catenin-like protein 1
MASSFPSAAALGPRFVDALSFEGPRPGYFFGTGDEGTGYYRDPQARRGGAMAPPRTRRPRDGDASDDDANAADDPTAKRARTSEGTARGQALLARAEAEAGGEGALADLAAAAPTDARGARRLLAALGKRVADNVRLRARHPDEPMRFLESEVDIMGALRALAGLAASPELFGLLYKAGGGGGADGGGGEDDDGGAAAAPHLASSSSALRTADATNKHLECILGLLAHENADIGCETLALLQELTDTDEGGASSLGAGGVDEARAQRVSARALARAVIAAGGLELVAQRATTLDEAAQEEAQGALAALALAENLSGLLGAEGALAVCRRAPSLLAWMLARVKRRAPRGGGAEGVDPIKLAAAEVLAAMLMGAEGASLDDDEEAEDEDEEGGAPPRAPAPTPAAASSAVADAVVAAGGVDALLRAAAPFRARDPDGAEEAELLENVFGALSALLSAPSPAARLAFVADEGVELCVLMLRSRRPGRAGALRALDFAATRCPPVARAVVEKGGLGPLFGLFMGRSKLKAGGAAEDGADGTRNKKRKKKKARMALDRDGARELEERTVSLLASLFSGLAAEAADEEEAEEEQEGGEGGGGGGGGAPRPPPPSSSSPPPSSARALLDRLGAKFVEGEHEKLDRLVELLVRHAEAVERAERALEQEAEAAAAERGAPPPPPPGAAAAAAAERALARLGAGEYPLQCCACCAAFLWASGDAALRARLLSLLHLRGRALQLVRAGVRGRLAALEEAAEAEAEEEEAAAGGAGGAQGPAAKGEKGEEGRGAGGVRAERARELSALSGALAALLRE